ncbi:MAG: hypothetical protein QOD48_1164, partial [Gaiellaceae bacterium]|nr:hypothetical protein [Gaiellaceae bacterium]
MVLVAGVRWASRCKDAGSPGSGTTGASEDAAARRPARPCGTVSISSNLLKIDGAAGPRGLVQRVDRLHVP